MWYLKLKDTVRILNFHVNSIEPIQPFLRKISTQKTLCNSLHIYMPVTSATDILHQLVILSPCHHMKLLARFVVNYYT